jgi:hypothetical protein
MRDAAVSFHPLQRLGRDLVSGSVEYDLTCFDLDITILKDNVPGQYDPILSDQVDNPVSREIENALFVRGPIVGCRRRGLQ